MTFRVTDDCDDGQDVSWKLFSDTRDWTWPAGDSEYRTPGLGYDGLGVETLIRLRNHGISTEFVRELVGAGYTDLTIEELIRVRQRGRQVLPELREPI